MPIERSSLNHFVEINSDNIKEICIELNSVTSRAIRMHEHFDEGYLLQFINAGIWTYFYIACFNVNSRGTARSLVVPHLHSPREPDINAGDTIYSNEKFCRSVESLYSAGEEDAVSDN